ncbi:hypothetical protein [Intrasporangium sp. DVR]|uniref:hypothetical protein n=1 Tax=Intrasporangium sp. DVR TaxID=3127867 RepID=UPI00313A5174
MAADATREPEPVRGTTWTTLERGAFMFGRCDACGFETPARRASYSLEMDRDAHTVLCHAQPVAPDGVARASQADVAEPEPAALDG